MDEHLTADQNLGLVQRIKALSSPMDPTPTEMKTKLIPLSDIRAIVFDIYGTLFISGSGDIGVAKAQYNEHSFREALASSGIITPKYHSGLQGARLLTQVIGEAHDKRRRTGVDFPEVDIISIWKEVFERIPEGALKPEISRQELRLFAVEYENRVNPVWPMPGLKETLSILSDRGKFLGIVSNAQFYTPLLFQSFLAESPEGLGFDPSCCTWSYRSLEAKPSTALFEKVLDNLDNTYAVSAAQTLYIGNDLLNDIWPANRLGCKTALFAGDRRSLRLRDRDERCKYLTPDLIIDDLRQLLRVV